MRFWAGAFFGLFVATPDEDVRAWCALITFAILIVAWLRKPERPKTMLSDGVFVSDDNGRTWRQLDR